MPHQPTAAESIGVIGAGNAAPHVRSGEQRTIGQHHRDAGKGVEILGIADKQSGDVSQTVARPGLDQEGRVPLECIGSSFKRLARKDRSSPLLG